MVWSPVAGGCRDGPPVWGLGTRHHGDEFLLLHLQPHQGHPLALLSQTPGTSILPDGSCAMLMGCYLTQDLIRWVSQVVLVVKKLPANSVDVRCEFDLWVGKTPWRRAWQPIPVFFPGEYPCTVEPDRLQTYWEESDTTERSSTGCLTVGTPPVVGLAVNSEGQDCL